MHLLEIIALYVCVGSFIALFFQYINIFSPDILSHDTGESARRVLRWPLSILVIVFPAYLFITRFIQKDLVKSPEKKEMKTRKWLLYFTLFAATILIIGDLIVLIFQFLNGGLTFPFLLKVLIILLIAGTVFIYYGWGLRKEIPVSKHAGMKMFTRIVAGIGVAVIIFGFFVAGSPFAERMRQFDERRVANLSSIQWQIINYYQSKEMLPEKLDDLRDDIQGFVLPTDPETREPYEYLATDILSFELCAIFNTSNISGEEELSRIPAPPRGVKPFGINETWRHESGRYCFERTIDPDIYPPFSERAR